jgi:hypothetical protein
VRDPAWREATWGPTGRRNDAAAQEHLSQLLARAAGTLSQSLGEDVLRAPLPAGATEARLFRRRAGVALGIERTEDDGSRVVRVVTSDPAGDRVTECVVAQELVPVVLWMNARSLSDRVAAEDVPRPAGVSVEDVAELFGVLAEAGAVAPA